MEESSLDLMGDQARVNGLSVFFNSAVREANPLVLFGTSPFLPVKWGWKDDRYLYRNYQSRLTILVAEMTGTWFKKHRFAVSLHQQRGA